MDPALRDILARRTASVQNSGGDGAPARGARPRAIPALPDVCSALAGMVPYTLQGEDRVRFLAKHIKQLKDADRMAMSQHVEHLVRRMGELDASDIDAGGAASRGAIWYRVSGDKRPDAAMGTYTETQTDVLFLNLLTRKQTGLLLRERSVDFSYQLRVENGRPLRFRATCYFDYDHLALNMRAITDEVRPLKSLEFHPLIEKGLMFKHVRDGLTLVTGVTGSGKSSTLDAIVDANNRDVPGHIVLIGKPIEYMHPSKQCIVRHREVGKDVRTFKEGIVQALRQDPDIVVIGEMRDPETISAGLEITDSGHKVFSTLHTSSAVESIDRIIGEYPSDEQNRIRNRLADVLRCVISQKLCPKIGGGRVLAKEVLWLTPSARAAIKNDNTSEIYQMMWEGWNQGMITLEQDLLRLARQRLITPETAMDYANNKRRLTRMMQGA